MTSTPPPLPIDLPLSPAHARSLQVAFFQNEKTAAPATTVSITWSGVVQVHKKRFHRPKKSGPMLGGYDLTDGRNNENVRTRSFIQLDIDTEVKKNKDTGQIIAVLRQAPPLDVVRQGINEYEWIANSSHSHDPANGIIKYRVTMLPDRDILPDEHEAVLEALDELLGGCLDRQAWPLSQAFYLPSCPVEMAADAFFVHNSGIALPVDQFVARGRQIVGTRQSISPQRAANANRQSEPDTPRRRAMLQDALRYISADENRNKWRDIVWAILSTGWHDAEAIAKAWCMTAPHRYTDDGFNNIVGSYNPLRPQTPTLGTLYYFARKGGWNG